MRYSIHQCRFFNFVLMKVLRFDMIKQKGVYHMNKLFPGVLLRRERLRRNWSQEGLCRGTCSVSYLSKIEQGKTEATPEILQLLFARLELPWHDSPEEQRLGAETVERFYEALLSCDPHFEALREEFLKQEDFLKNGPYALDALLMRGFLFEPRTSADEAAEPILTGGSLPSSECCRTGTRRPYACTPAPTYFLWRVSVPMNAVKTMPLRWLLIWRNRASLRKIYESAEV